MMDAAIAPPTGQGRGPGSLTELFWAFTWLALQGFGGVLAVVQRELVERRQWLTLEEFVDEWSVAQILPGPNVINLALMLGGRYFGVRGAF
ncbi:MAG: chromate transporter, partial [Rhodoferax sp.]|nr:chromate transporter [Rhodoferax sp.]